MSFNERFAPKCKDKETLEMYLSNECKAKLKVTGDIIDEIRDLDGNILEVREGHNLVVDSFLVLVSALLSNDSEYSGAQYWAVGSGADSWDENLPNPQSNETELVNEIGRVALTSADFSYLDSHLDPSVTPTNVLQIVHTFGSADCNGTWREFGIFGGDATSTANSGIMVDKKNHAVITKTSDMEISRTLRITFQFSA